MATHAPPRECACFGTKFGAGWRVPTLDAACGCATALQDDTDPDNMTYEQLTALGECVGTEQRGVAEVRLCPRDPVWAAGTRVQVHLQEPFVLVLYEFVSVRVML